jgi:hypothetical protein
VLLGTATWINAVKEPETLPAKVLVILRDQVNSFFLSSSVGAEAAFVPLKPLLLLGELHRQDVGSRGA